MDGLDKYIDIKTNSINVIGISDGISENYLKEICEGYHELKIKNATLKTKLSPDKMSEYGFKQVDWFYCKDDFEIGFLFYKSLDGKSTDKVDIFYGKNQLFAIPLTYCEELEYIYKIITGKELKK